MYQERLKIYDTIAKKAGIERKGKTMPYTSSNGYMFSLLNKNAELGIRFSKEEQEDFIKKYHSSQFMSYGSKMKGYVLITDVLLKDLDFIVELLKKSKNYVDSLPPK